MAKDLSRWQRKDSIARLCPDNPYMVHEQRKTEDCRCLKFYLPKF